jgi:pimeloyl-ACP methyl ester carboxylesterase
VVTWDRVRSVGPVVVMAHALGTDLEIWDHQISALDDRYRIVCYDWRGHGGTDAPSGAYSLDQLVDDAVGLFDALELDRVQSRWHIIDGRHFSNVEFPDQFNPPLRAFLDDVTA